MATKKTTTESPMMMQFNNLKAKHPDALLLFRCGDFYETYAQDAEHASKILGITLTKRTTDRIPMAGFPYHALDTYLPKLIRAGKRVAICDQIEKPNNRAVEVVDDVKPAEKPAEQPVEKQPEDMTIAELMAAYKQLKDANYAIQQLANQMEQQLMDAQARAERAEKKLEAITNIIKGEE